MAELALGIVGAVASIDTCIKSGRFLAQATRDFKRTDDKFNEIHLRIDICWTLISDQLEITRDLESSMTLDQKDLHGKTLQVLQAKLDEAIQALSKFDKSPVKDVGKRIYFATQRDVLENVVGELESWQRRFEPRWFQLIKTAPQAFNISLKVRAADQAEGPARDAFNFRQALKPGQSLLFKESTLDSCEMVDIPHCPAVKAVHKERNRTYIIDSVSVDAVKVKDARNLAYRFRDSNPTTSGIMKCKGFIRSSKENSLSIIFTVPDDIEKVHGLRQLLISSGHTGSLGVRLSVARQLITAVYYMHLYEFVHKTICPETILCLEKANQEDFDPMVSLVGFQVIRHADGKTNTAKIGTKNLIYQHPSRQVTKTTDYIMQHDIYSLGVCLLEIGLWESLIKYEPGGNVQLHSRLSGESTTTKEQLVLLTRGVLKARMGQKYSKIVETCLTCLDPDNPEFGDPHEFQDDDGVELGDRYMKKIMDTFNTISI